MAATPEDRRVAQDSLKAVDLAEDALGLLPGAYDDERITFKYMEYCGECNMTKALRWQQLQLEGKTAEEAHAQVQQEFTLKE